MKLWTSILAAIYNTLATFGHLQLDPNASKENFHIAFGTADPPYQQMCQIEWIWRPIRTHPGPKNPPKIHHWPPTSPHCDPKVAPGPHQAPRTMKKWSKNDQKRSPIHNTGNTKSRGGGRRQGRSLRIKKSNIFKLWLQMHHFSRGFDKDIEPIQTTALNASFSIGFDKEIEHIQTITLNTSFSIGFDKEI